MIRKNFVTICSLLVFSTIVVIPIVIMPRDMWDGTIIEYASEIQNLEGIKIWFFEASWFFQYYLSAIVILLSDLVGLSYKTTHAIFVLGFIFILLREIDFFSRSYLDLSRGARQFATLFASTFSVWHVLYSSIMLMHLGCLVFGLVFLRLIHQKTRYFRVVGYAGLIVVFNFNSMLVFIPVFSYLYDTFNPKQKNSHRFARPSRETVLVCIFSVVFYFFVRKVFTPHGKYENYNNLIILSESGLISALKLSLEFATFLIPTFIVIALVSLATIAFEPRNGLGNLSRLMASPKKVLCLLFLFVASFIPYVAVGKAESLLRVYDWDSRQAILLVVPLSMLTAYYISFLNDNAINVLIKKFISVGAVSILIFQAGLLANASLYKFNRQLFVDQMEKTLRSYGEMPPSGLLEIVGAGIPKPSFRVYEANYLMFQATGNADWWTRIAEKKLDSFAIPCFIKRDQRYQIKYIYNYKKEHLKNQTTISIEASGFVGFWSTFLNALGFGKTTIEILTVQSELYDTESIKTLCQI